MLPSGPLREAVVVEPHFVARRWRGELPVDGRFAAASRVALDVLLEECPGKPGTEITPAAVEDVWI
jgi:hypothetical protein